MSQKRKKSIVNARRDASTAPEDGGSRLSDKAFTTTFLFPLLLLLIFCVSRTIVVGHCFGSERRQYFSFGADRVY